MFLSLLIFCSTSFASIRRNDLRDSHGNEIKPHAKYWILITNQDKLGHSGYKCEGIMIANILEDLHDDDLFTIQKITLSSRFNCLSRNSLRYQQIKNLRRNNLNTESLSITEQLT